MPAALRNKILDSNPFASSKSASASSPVPGDRRLVGKRAAVVLYSHYPADPRPRRAAEAMIEAGMSVDLICLRENERESSREVVNGVNVLRLPILKKRGGKIAYLLRYAGFVAACSIILALRVPGGRYDIVHVHNMPDFLVFSGLLPRLFGSKIILDLHDPMPELVRSIYDVPRNHWLVRLLIRLERCSISVADLVLTPNIAFRELFISRGCPSKKIMIVMNSPQSELFNPRRFQTEASRSERNVCFQLMYHGLLVERHGLDTAIRAVAMIREHIPSLQFHIYGDRTPFMDQMNDLIKKLGLEGTILYHGRKSHYEIAKALASIDLGIIPNRRNPFTELNMPTRIFENLAMDRPVIVPNTKGIRDYFDESQIIFFESDNVESLAQAINWAYLHPQQVQETVFKGKRVLRAHTWNRERERFVESLRDLISAPRQIFA
jgi:glycosyltransferase involved in cell wall biosynthesis